MQRSWMKGWLSAVTVLALMLACWAGISGAQTFRGSVLGTVTDFSGGTVAGAQITSGISIPAWSVPPCPIATGAIVSLNCQSAIMK